MISCSGINGAPRPMKMGTTASPWRYDAAAAQAIPPDNLRRTAILRYASWAAVFLISRVVRLPFDSGPLNQSRWAMKRRAEILPLFFAQANSVELSSKIFGP